jgi:hypothetical protein
LKHLKKFDTFLIQEKSEVKYSETAFNYILDVIKEYDKKRSIFKGKKSILKELGFQFVDGEAIKPLKIPVGEIVYDSPRIKLGLMLWFIFQGFDESNEGLFFTGLTKESILNCREIFKSWLFEKTIHPSGQKIIDKILSDGELIYNLKVSDSGGGHFDFENEIMISLGTDSSERVERVARHELQHLTQFFNTQLLNLGNIFNSGFCKLLCDFDVMTIEEINKIFKSFTHYNVEILKDKTEEWKLDNFESVFNYLLYKMYRQSVLETLDKIQVGLGKTKSSYNYLELGNSKNLFMKMGRAISLDLTNLLSRPIGKFGISYFGSDVEYQTWLSDTIDIFTKTSKYSKIIRENDVDTAFDIISKKMKTTGWSFFDWNYANHFKLMKRIRPEAEGDFLKLLKERIKKIKNGISSTKSNL